LLSPSWLAETGMLFAAGAASPELIGEAMLAAPDAAAALGLVVGFRPLYASGSRLLKNGDCSAMMYFL
jgi:hypothetical protein